MDIPKKYLLNEAQAAEYLQKSVASIRKMRQFDNGPIYIKMGHNISYRKEDLDNYIEEHQSSTQAILDNSPSKYMFDVRIDSKLDDFLATTALRCPNPRCQLPKLIKNFLNYNDSRVTILQGLRRTGKSVLLAQALAELEKNSNSNGKSAYIRCFEDDTMQKSSATLKLLKKRGYKYVCIDEITLLSDFMLRVDMLSDNYAQQGR